MGSKLVAAAAFVPVFALISVSTYLPPRVSCSPGAKVAESRMTMALMLVLWNVISMSMREMFLAAMTKLIE